MTKENTNEPNSIPYSIWNTKTNNKPGSKYVANDLMDNQLHHYNEGSNKQKESNLE